MEDSGPLRIMLVTDAWEPQVNGVVRTLTRTVEECREMGHEVEVRDRTWGNMHGVLWNRASGAVEAGSDPRWPSGRAIVK